MFVVRIDRVYENPVSRAASGIDNKAFRKSPIINGGGQHLADAITVIERDTLLMTVDIKAQRNQLRDTGICTNTALTQGFGPVRRVIRDVQVRGAVIVCEPIRLFAGLREDAMQFRHDSVRGKLTNGTKFVPDTLGPRIHLKSAFSSAELVSLVERNIVLRRVNTALALGIISIFDCSSSCSLHCDTSIYGVLLHYGHIIL